MIQRASTIALLPILLLAACSGDDGDGTGENVTLRDMEVVDGTANDAMVNLDNVASDIAPMAGSASADGNQAAPVNTSEAAAPAEADTQ